MAVVKADGYGHGLLPAARAAQAGGATWLATAQQPEAVALRDAGVEGRIFTWLHVPGNDFAAALTRDIDVAASATWALDDIVDAARATGRTARVHLKADTGLGRNGAYGQDFLDLVAAARLHEAEGAVRVVGVWSHFAYADEPDHPTVRRQREVFEEAVRAVEAALRDVDADFAPRTSLRGLDRGHDALVVQLVKECLRLHITSSLRRRRRRTSRRHPRILLRRRSRHPR